MKVLRKKKIKNESNKVELINGDTIKEMKKLISKNIKIDKIITSPPYNTMRNNNPSVGYDLYEDGMANDDYIKWTLEIFDLYDKLLNKNGCICYNMSYGGENTNCMSLTISEILKNTNFVLADIIVWKKKNAIPNSRSSNKLTRIVEFVYIFCKKEDFKTFNTNKKVVSIIEKTGQKTYDNVFNFFVAKNNDGLTKCNKATFSTNFVQHLLNLYVRPNDVVMDNFGGTGTTALACQINDIKCYSIELSKLQHEYGLNRLKKDKLQKRLQFW